MPRQPPASSRQTAPAKMGSGNTAASRPVAAASDTDAAQTKTRTRIPVSRDMGGTSFQGGIQSKRESVYTGIVAMGPTK